MHDVGTDLLAIERERAKADRWTILAAGLGLAGAIAYGAWTSVPVSATAVGSVVAESRVQAVGSPEGGKVSKVFVRPHQAVKAGDPLVELDREAAEAEESRWRYARRAAEADVRRLEAEIEGRAPDWTGIDPESAASAQSAWKARTGGRGQEISAKEAEAESLSRMIESLGSSLAANERILASQEELGRERIIAFNRIEAQRAQTSEIRGHHEKAKSDLNGVRAQISGLRSSHRAALMEEMEDAKGKMREAGQQERRAEALTSHLVLTAPVSGRVQSLAVHGGGAAAKPGETLVEIIEDGSPLRVEVGVPADDAGHIRVGSEVSVLKGHGDSGYAPIVGRVASAAPNATTDAKERSTTRVEILIDSDHWKGRSGVLDYKVVDGAPVTVFLPYGERSLLQSLFGDFLGQASTAIDSVAQSGSGGS